MAKTIIFERSTRRLSIDADKVTTLNETSRGLLRTALVIAAEKFAANAGEFQAIAKHAAPHAATGHLRIARQFEKQASDTTSLIALIDGDDDAERETAVLFVADGY